MDNVIYISENGGSGLILLYKDGLGVGWIKFLS